MYIDAYRLTMIGAVLIVLLIMFGGPDNPKKFRIKTKEEKWREGIEEIANSKVTRGQGGLSGLMGAPSSPNNSTFAPAGVQARSGQYPQNQYQQYQNQVPQPNYGNTPIPGTPYQSPQLGTANAPAGMTLPYQTNNYNPLAQPFIVPSPTPGGAMGAPPPNSWGRDAPMFPQAFPKWTNSPKDAIISPTINPGPSGAVDPRFFLRSGKQVYFAGKNVYVQDDDGKMVPMPDGEYIDKESRRTIRVRNGQRIIASN